MAPAGVLDRGRRRLFFLAFCLAAPSSYRVDRGRHLGCRPSLGGSMSSSLSRFSGWSGFIPWRGAAGLTGARDGTRGCVGSRAAPAFFFLALLPGGAVELPGRSRPAPGVSTFAGVAQCRALSPDFPAPVFIPWRGADGFDRRSGWHPRVCWIEGGAGFFSIKGNKAIADKPPLLSLSTKSHDSNERPRVSIGYAKT